MNNIYNNNGTILEVMTMMIMGLKSQFIMG